MDPKSKIVGSVFLLAVAIGVGALGALAPGFLPKERAPFLAVGFVVAFLAVLIFRGRNDPPAPPGPNNGDYAP
jgi:hypothetical protein